MTDELADLITRWRRHAERNDPADDWDNGYNAGVANAADDLERRLEEGDE